MSRHFPDFDGIEFLSFREVCDLVPEDAQKHLLVFGLKPLILYACFIAPNGTQPPPLGPQPMRHSWLPKRSPPPLVEVPKGSEEEQARWVKRWQKQFEEDGDPEALFCGQFLQNEALSLYYHSKTPVKPPPNALPREWGVPVFAEIFFDKAQVEDFKNARPWLNRPWGVLPWVPKLGRFEREPGKRGPKGEPYMKILNKAKAKKGGGLAEDEALAELQNNGFPNARRYRNDKGEDRILISEGHTVSIETFRNARTTRKAHDNTKKG